MSLLPRTLSNSLRKEIGQVRSNDDLIKALKKNPDNLLKFILQAFGSLAYVKANKNLVCAIWLEVTELALSKTLSWGCVEKTHALFERFINIKFFFPNDLKVTFYGKPFQGSKLVFLLESKALKDCCLDRPDEADLAMCRLSSRFNTHKEFDLFYQLLQTKNYSLLDKLSHDEVLNFIQQAEEGGFETLCEDLQDYFSKRITGFDAALTYLATAIRRKFKKIEKKCRETLENALFFKDAIDGNFLYYALSLENKTFLKYYPESDLRELSADYLANIDELKKMQLPFRLEWITLIIEENNHALAGFIETSREEDLLKLKSKIRLPQVSLNKKYIKKLTFNDRYRFKPLSIIGLLLHFDHAEEVYFVDTGLTDGLIISLINNLKINLKHISFTCSKLNETNFIQIQQMKFLKWLTLIEECVSARSFAILMRMDNLEALGFIDCKLEISESLIVSINIRELTFKGISSVSENGWKALFSLCVNLRRLHIEGCLNLSLREYPHASCLEELTISFLDLEKEAGPTADLSMLDRFIHLKKLNLIGKCPDALKPAIRKYLTKFKISIRAALL